jgi:hypothetical protein
VVYGLWVQAGAIIISAVGVVLTILHNGKVARRRATLDFLFMEQSTAFLRRYRRHFVVIKEKGNLAQWAAKDQRSTEEALIVGSTLNKYELLAIAMKNRALDESIYKMYLRTGVVGDWIACKPYVMEVRNQRGNHTLYCRFQDLAAKWAQGDEVPRV